MQVERYSVNASQVSAIDDSVTTLRQRCRGLQGLLIALLQGAEYAGGSASYSSRLSRK